MVEHVSLRLRFKLMRELQNFDTIYGIEEFVRSSHARVEDEIVFPALRELLLSEGKQELVKNVLSRLEADHRMIDTIGDQIKLRTIQGDAPTLSKRISLYCNTVETHNTTEEVQLFPHWNVKTVEERELSAKALEINRQFGLNRYYELTGISEQFLRHALNF
jgi:hemerythrin superfamily protein